MIRPLACAALAVIATFATSSMAQRGEVTPEIQAMLDHPDFRLLELDLGEKGRMKQTVVATRETVRNGVSVKMTVESKYDVEYALDDDDETYTVRKKLAGFRLLDPQGKLAGPELDVLNSLWANIANISYSADDSLSPREIRDWDGLKRVTSESFRGLLDLEGAAEVEEATKVLDAFFARLTPASAAQMFLPGDLLMAIPHNIGLVLKQPLVADSQIQAAIGDSMLRAKEKLELTAWDESRNRAHVVYDFAPTHESVVAFATDFLPKLLRSVGAPEEVVANLDKQLQAGLADSIMSVDTHCDYHMAIDTGLVASGTCTTTRSVNVQGRSEKKIDRYEFSEAFAE